MSDVSQKGSRARLVPGLLVIAAVVIALFASHGMTTHSASGGYTVLSWASVESAAMNVPVATCCSAEPVEHIQPAFTTIVTQPDGDHHALMAICAFFVLFILLLLRAPRIVAVARTSWPLILARIDATVDSFVRPPALAVLCVSRT